MIHCFSLTRCQQNPLRSGVATLMTGIMLALFLCGTSVSPADAPAPQLLEQTLLGETPEALANAVREQGDPARGALIFHQPFMSCTKCHATSESQENTLGPNLAKLGKETTNAYLIESILKPSSVVKKGFETVTIAMVDGKTVTGLLAEDRADAIVLRDPSQDGNPITILKADIDARKDGGPSIMPAGLVNALASRQQFLDLVSYLRAIADGGPERAKALRPDPSKIAGLILPDYESKIDHAGLISALGPESLERGEAIYNRVCINCHGTKDKPGSLPTSLKFASGRFKNGSDPHSLYRTLTLGYGQMPPQTWMVPSQKYNVIHYLRETFLKKDNPSQYVAVDTTYLNRLPKGTTRGPEPSTIEPWSAMDYGPSLTATYEISNDESNFAHKGVAIRLDAGPGGVSRGRLWTVFEHDTMRMASAWSGDGFIDWNSINFNGQHGVHPKIVGLVEYANPNAPGWANPETGKFDDPRILGRDDRRYGPLPRNWAHFQGEYRNGDRVILAYTIGKTSVLETPAVETGGATPVFSRAFEIGPRDKAMTLQVARASKGALRTIKPSANGGASAVFLGADPASKPNLANEPQLLKFDGKTAIEIAKPDGIDMSRGDYTVAARFQTRKGGTLMCETTPGERWVPDGKSLFVRDGRLVFDIGWVGAIASKQKVDDGLWHLAVLTYEAKTHRARLEIDGKPSAEGVLAPKGDLAKRVVRIGYTAPDFPGPLTYFDGRISEIQIYDNLIASNDIVKWMNSTNNEQGLVARWKPDDTRGDTVKDESGRGLDGQVVRNGSPPDDSGVITAVFPPDAGLSWSSTPDGHIRLTIPSGSAKLGFTLKVARVPGGVNAEAIATTFANNAAANLVELTKGGPTRWPEVLKTTITPGANDGAFAVDFFGLPENNPWLAQLRLTGFDFLDSEGKEAAVCTWDGDVWRVSGLDASSSELSWKRIASGMFQPLGLKFLEGKIFVCCRDRIVILRDLNGDGETDFYENFNSDHQVTEHFHEFAMDLQTDAAGNFYYAKAARHGKKAVVPQHGTLLKVSPVGLRTEILATGFRAPNGVCLNDDGTFFMTDQEGFWHPKNRINHVKVGGFYGNMWGYHDVTDPSDTAMEQPVCWITNAFDRSPAEILRVTGKAWGPLKGSLLNLSYGNGRIFVVPTETTGGSMQGGMCALPIAPLPTGVMRGRFGPRDGQLYALGMVGWASDRSVPGGFYRVHATGKPMFLPVGMHASRKGLRITFTEPLSAAEATNPSRYALKTWSLKRSAGYGSEHYDEKPLQVTTASLSEDGKTVTLTIPDIKPTWSMEVKYTLKGATGQEFEGTIHNTIHSLGESF